MVPYVAFLVRWAGEKQDFIPSSCRFLNLLHACSALDACALFNNKLLHFAQVYTFRINQQLLLALKSSIFLVTPITALGFLVTFCSGYSSSCILLLKFCIV